jgi:hypothetical protein
MKAITEFTSFTLNRAAQTKAALLAAGKTPEEIQEGLATEFKFEGDKLKHFVNAIEVATTHKDNLKRVLVCSLAEGETVPAKAVLVEETHYVPEFLILARPAAKVDDRKGGRGGQRGGGSRGGNDSKKSSPWGLTPEEKAAKKKS